MSTADEPDGLRRLGPRRPVDRALLTGHAVDVAPAVLGLLLVREEEDGPDTVVRVVETEAYRETDPASHSYRGRTPRVVTMFGPPGHAYVYFTYGMHHCMNVSCEPDGVGAAVLFRAAVVLAGGDAVRARRGPKPADRDLLAGPARLTQGLGVDRDWDGIDLCDPTSRLHLATDGWRPAPHDVVTGPRVGVREAADVAWRFHLRGVREVSRYSRHPRARAADGAG